ncbi:MAG: aminoglycoside phosphotransferase family protein [Myxococcota bacterium]
MLASDDAGLVARDRALPGLETLLDEKRLHEALASRGFDGIEALEADYVRYKPGTSCLVAYRFRLAGVPGRLHAITYGRRAEGKLEKAALLERREGGGRTEAMLGAGGCLYAREARALVCFHPFDPELPALARLHDPGRRTALLARIFDSRDGTGTGAPGADASWHPTFVEAAVVEPLAYKPGRRFVARVSGASGPSAVLRLYASAGRHRRTRALRGLRNGEVLRVPTRVGGSKRHRATAVTWLAGESLRTRVRGGRPVGGSELEAVASAVAELHATPLDSLSGLGFRHPAEGLGEVETGLAALCPEQTERIASIRLRLEDVLATVECAEALVHGDLYDKQVVLCEDGVGIVDLDDLRRGDPREDLALVVAHWLRDGLVGAGRGEELVGRWIAHYETCVGRAMPGLAGFVAAALFRLAPHPFRGRSARWQSEVTALLDRVEGLLDAGLAGVV